MIPATDKERMEAITEVCSLSQEPAGRKIVRLLDILIEDMRQQNDTVEENGLKRNQGKIAAWDQLKEYVTKGLPDPSRFQKRPEKTIRGGY